MDERERRRHTHTHLILIFFRLAYWIRDLSYCPRKREATRQRQCFKSCFDDSDCRSRYRSCVCDYDCGMSCVKRGRNNHLHFLINHVIFVGISCPFLTPPEHGQITYSNGNKFSSRATYECHQGFILEGPKYRYCQGDMWWGPSDNVPYCAKEGNEIHFSPSIKLEMTRPDMRSKVHQKSR